MTDKEKLEKIKSLADKMYTSMQYLTSDTRPIRKAMEEYHSFIVHEYHKEEPVSEDLDSFAIKYAQDKPYPVTVCQAVRVGANWQKEKDEKEKSDIYDIAVDVGRKLGETDMKQQMMNKILYWLNDNVDNWIDMPYDQNSFIRQLENIMND